MKMGRRQSKNEQQQQQQKSAQATKHTEQNQKNNFQPGKRILHLIYSHKQ